MTELQLPISKTFLFVDTISVLISISHHTVKYKEPFRRLLASTNVNLYKIGQLSHQLKEEIPLFINQHKQVNLLIY